MQTHPHRVAWITLLTGFLLFCAFCAGGIWLVRYFLFDWTMGLHTTVYVSRGTIGVLAQNDTVEQNVRDQFGIGSGDRVSTDELAQGELSFRDPLDQDTVVATVQLMAGSELELRQAHRPRFFGDDPFSIRLTAVSGTLEVVIAAGLEREVRLEIEGGGRTVRLDQAGHYAVSMDTTAMTVQVWRGEALMINQAGQTKLVERDQEGTLGVDGQFVVTGAAINLVRNHAFEEVDEDQFPLGRWGCWDGEIEAVDESDDSPPGGIWERVIFQGRPAMHIVRTSGQQLGHGETFCGQTLGLDVSEYESLVIRANLYIVSHSVPGCGQEATECALMLRLDYRNGQGNDYQWLHGFYSHFEGPVVAEWPLQCGSCAQPHERINGGRWYTFESEDLIAGLPEELIDLRPVRIHSITFDSSGHQYEVYVGDVSLIAQSSSD